MTSSKKTLRATFAAISVATLTMVATPAISFAAGEDGGTAGSATSSDAELTVADMPAGSYSIVVHKSTQTPENGKRDDGTVNDEFKDSVKPVNGVTFKIYKFGDFNTGKNADWRAASEKAEAFNKLTASERDAKIAAGEFAGVTIYSTTKSADEIVKGSKNTKDSTTFSVDTAAGKATFSGIKEKGFYLVQEVMPAGKKAVEAENGSVTLQEKTYKLGEGEKEVTLERALPFVVALPMTNQDYNSDKDVSEENPKWLSDVNVYPKNGTSTIQKKVEDIKTPGAGNESSKLTYTVKVDVPSGYGDEGNNTAENGATKLTSFQILDKLPKSVTYLDEKASNEGEDVPRVQIVKANGEKLSSEYDLVKDQDYVIFKEGTGDNADKYVSVVFKDSGKDKLVKASANSGAHVVWTLVGKLGKLKMGENEFKDVTNNAYLIPPNRYTPTDDGTDHWNPENPDNPGDNPDNPGDNPTPPGPHVEVTSKYGAVKIVKKEKGSDVRLNGAKFKLFTCNKDGVVTDYKDGFKAKKADYDVNGDTDTLAISVDGVSEFETTGEGDNKGTVTISGLELNDWNNADSEKNASSGQRDATGLFYCLFETKAPKDHELLANPIKFQLLTTDKNMAAKEIDIENVKNNGGFNLPLTGGKGVLPLIALGGLLVIGAGGYAAVAAKRNRKEA